MGKRAVPLGHRDCPLTPGGHSKLRIPAARSSRPTTVGHDHKAAVECVLLVPRLDPHRYRLIRGFSGAYEVSAGFDRTDGINLHLFTTGRKDGTT